MKVIHISEIPQELIGRRDRWRYFWSWIPVIGEIYKAFWYVKPMNRWLKKHNVGTIVHN